MRIPTITFWQGEIWTTKKTEKQLFSQFFRESRTISWKKLVKFWSNFDWKVDRDQTLWRFQSIWSTCQASWIVDKVPFRIESDNQAFKIKGEYLLHSHATNTNAQCGNLRILLPLRFYVKSDLVTLGAQRMQYSSIWSAWILIFRQIPRLKMVKSHKSSKLWVFKMVKIAVFGFLKLSNLISRKIPVKEKFRNCHTVLHFLFSLWSPIPHI